MTVKILTMQEFYGSESKGYIKRLILMYMTARINKDLGGIERAVSNINTRCMNIMYEHDYTHTEYSEAMPHYFSEATFWFYREIFRLCPEDGKYPRSVNRLSVKLPLLHFVHVSLDNKAQVAYVKDEKHGKDDRQMRQKFGRYLKANVMQDAKDHEIEAVVGEYRAKYMTDDWEVKFTTDSSEVAWVYDNGPDSCMSHDMDSYETGGIHPCSVYATDSCCVAYILDPKDDSRVTGRAVINKNDMQWTKAYGDEDILEEKLRDLDYTEGGLAGCKLLKIQTDTGSGNYVMPYLDGTCTHLFDEGDFFLVTERGGICADQTDGTLYPQDQSHCHDCDNTYPDEELQEVYGDRTICDDCRNNNYTWAFTSISHGRGSCQNYIPDDEVLEVTDKNDDTDSYCETIVQEECIEVDGEWYMKDAVFECEITEQHYLLGKDGPWEMVDEYGDTQAVSLSTLDDLVTHFKFGALTPLMESHADWGEALNAKGNLILPPGIFDLNIMLEPWVTGMVYRSLCQKKFRPGVAETSYLSGEAARSCRHVAEVFGLEPEDFIVEKMMRMWRKELQASWDYNLYQEQQKYSGPPTKAQMVAHLMNIDYRRISSSELDLLNSLLSSGTPILKVTEKQERLIDYNHKDLAYSVNVKNQYSLTLMTQWIG